MTTEAKAERIREIAEQAKAERIETLDVRDKTAMTDYFVVCSGTSDLHMRSIADRIAETMKEAHIRPHHIEGEDSGWVLLDYGDVVCHVMREEQRQFYDLESLWESLPSLEGVQA
ncbi:MAG: ribosome silencing factor [Armatimonadetes bacterium]|nr:ribosome silencing factor [Armatimonadota bacterium]